ncbi:MAG: hypothetical protein ACE3JP_14505 [Ectobacillus sp.]
MAAIVVLAVFGLIIAGGFMFDRILAKKGVAIDCERLLISHMNDMPTRMPADHERQLYRYGQ